MFDFVLKILRKLTKISTKETTFFWFQKMRNALKLKKKQFNDLYFFEMWSIFTQNSEYIITISDQNSTKYLVLLAKKKTFCSKSKMRFRRFQEKKNSLKFFLD